MTQATATDRLVAATRTTATSTPATRAGTTTVITSASLDFLCMCGGPRPAAHHSTCRAHRRAPILDERYRARHRRAARVPANPAWYATWPAATWNLPA